MNIFQNIINKKRGHNFALSHYGTSFSTSKDYFFHVCDKDDLSRLTPRIPSYGDEYKLWFRSVDLSIKEVELLQFPAVYFSPTAFHCLRYLCEKHFQHEKLFVYRTKKRIKLNSYQFAEYISFSSVPVQLAGVINDVSLVHDFIVNYCESYKQILHQIENIEDRRKHSNLAEIDLFNEFYRRQFIAPKGGHHV